MKICIKCIWISMFSLLVSLTRAQNDSKPFEFVCTYKLEYQPDSTNLNSRKTEDMQLFLNRSSSLFESKNKVLRDSASFSNAATNSFGSMSFVQATVTNFNYSIIKDLNKIVTLDYVYHDLFEYSEEKKVFNWEILSDTITINGFRCQKALTTFGGRSWVAWFAAEIPISDGPYKFNGLPGLIIKINDVNNYYIFTLTSFVNSLKNVKIYKRNEPIIVDKKKFFETLKNYNENRFAIDQQRGIVFTSGQSEIKKRLDDLAKRNNNPIELITK